MEKSKTLTIKEYDLPIILSKDADGGYIARCPSWSDCYSQGDTIEEAVNEISYVASSLIELYNEENIKIPLKLKRTSQKSSQDIKLTFPLIISSDQYVVS